MIPKIKVIQADIVNMHVDAIVNAANTGLVGGSGVCGAIHDAAGPKLDEECKKLGGCLRGEAKITNGYNLPAKYIIHTVGPIYGQHNGLESEILYSCYYSSMSVAESADVGLIAFPEISTGIYRYPVKEARKIAVDAITDYFEDCPSSTVRQVFLVRFSDDKAEKFTWRRGDLEFD